MDDLGVAAPAKDISRSSSIISPPLNPETIDPKSAPFSLDDIPGKDLFLILNWRESSSMFSFFDKFYADCYQKDHPDVGRNEFYARAQRLSTAKLRQLVTDFLSTHPDFKLHFQEVLDFVSAPEFQQIFQQVCAELAPGTADTPYYETFLILKQPEFDKQIYLTTLKTNEFEAFQNLLKERYAINPNNNLITVLDIYLDPDRLQFYQSKTTQKAFQILKAYFPAIELNSVSDINLIKRVNKWWPNQSTELQLQKLVESGQYAKIIRQKAQDEVFLISSYGFAVASEPDLRALLVCDQKTMKLLKQPAALQNWQYFKQTYPDKVDYANLQQFLWYWEGYAGLLNAFAELKVWPAVFDDFLNLFSTNLREIKILEATSAFRDISIDYGSILNDQDFKAFIEYCSREYPKLFENIDIETIADVYRAYIDKENFIALNQALSSLGTTTDFGFKIEDVPDFNLKDADLKLQILQEITGQGLEAVVITRESSGLRPLDISTEWELFSRDEFTAVLELFNNGEARKVYDALLNNWQLARLELGDFLRLLSRADERAFYLDPQNAQKFIFLRDRYDIHVNNGENYREIISLDDICLYAEDLVAGYAFYADEQNAECLARYALDVPRPVAKKLADGKPAFSIMEISHLSARYTEIDRLDLPAVAQTLAQTYDLSPKDIGSIIYNGYKLSEDYLLTRLKDPGTLEAFKWLKQFYAGQTIKFDFLGTTTEISFSNRDILDRALLIGGCQYAFPVFQQLNDLGFDLTVYTVVGDIADILLLQVDVCQNIMDPEFVAFYQKITATFYGGANSIVNITEIAELYSSIKDNPQKMQLLFSPEFEKVLSFIRTPFVITKLHSSTLSAVLQIADGFNQEKMQLLVERLKSRGENPSANDLILLSEISKNPGLEKMLFNRRKLIKNMEKVYRSKAYPRERLDQVAYLTAPIIGASKNPDAEQAEKIKDEYTERPALEELSNLQLLRLNLLRTALQKPETLATLGKVVYRDIHDKITEYGGTVLFEQGEISFNQVHSISEFDGSYANLKYHFFTHGLATFHLHALEADMSEFSGPSGWLESNRGGDVSYVNLYDATDVVITSMGHPKDAAGNDIKNRLLINVDMYYVDKRDPANPKVSIIDLGQYAVPYEK